MGESVDIFEISITVHQDSFSVVTFFEFVEDSHD